MVRGSARVLLRGKALSPELMLLLTPLTLQLSLPFVQ